MTELIVVGDDRESDDAARRETCERNPWGMDLSDQHVYLQIAAERLSIVRYVYLVQIEDGIATAAQRASLEYADAVLIGWPENDASDLVTLGDDQMKMVHAQMREMEEYIAKFRAMEVKNDLEGMTDVLIRVTERVAEVRRAFQPRFLLPTFAEIRRVVQAEWDEDMGRIDIEAGADGEQVRQETLEEAAGDGDGDNQ
ncbi:phosphoribosylglycinamide synthetase [Bifidobacterium choloepi]